MRFGREKISWFLLSVRRDKLRDYGLRKSNISWLAPTKSHGCIKRQDRQWPVQFGLSSRGGNPLRGARWDIWPKPKQKQWYGSIGRFWPIKGCYSQPQQCMLARLASSIMRASIWAILEFFSWVWLVDQNVNKASGEQIHRPLPLLILLGKLRYYCID